MNKNKKVILATIGASGVVITTAFFGGLGLTAYAASDGQTFLSRVSELVGVKEADLSKAMETARDEGLRPERGLGRGEGMMEGKMMRGRDNMSADLAAFLGISEDKVKESLDAGKKPYEIVEENGKSEADFHEYMLQNRIKRMQERLDNYQTESEKS